MNKVQNIECWEYVCAIYIARHTGNPREISSQKFLGTGFFVTRNGLALTAAHVIPDSIEPNEVILCSFRCGDSSVVCFMQYFHRIPGFDCAMIKFMDARSKYLPIVPAAITMGTDVEVLGISEHETAEPGRKQMRIFKGYVVLSANSRLELNFPVPSGMSGSPVLTGNHIVGMATGRVISEEIEEQTEEVEMISNQKEVIRISTLRRMTYYGTALPFSALADVPLRKDDDETLLDVINMYNNSSDSLIVPGD